VREVTGAWTAVETGKKLPKREQLVIREEIM
jgi:hypothetical protein